MFLPKIEKEPRKLNPHRSRRQACSSGVKVCMLYFQKKRLEMKIINQGSSNQTFNISWRLEKEKTWKPQSRFPSLRLPFFSTLPVNKSTVHKTTSFSGEKNSCFVIYLSCWSHKVSGSTTPLGRSVSSASFHSDLNLLVVFRKPRKKCFSAHPASLQLCLDVLFLACSLLIIAFTKVLYLASSGVKHICL